MNPHQSFDICYQLTTIIYTYLLRALYEIKFHICVRIKLIQFNVSSIRRDRCLFTCKLLPVTNKKKEFLFSILLFCTAQNVEVRTKMLATKWNHLLFMFSLWKRDISFSFVRWSQQNCLVASTCSFQIQFVSCVFNLPAFFGVFTHFFFFWKSCAIWMTNRYFLSYVDWQQPSH